MATIARQASRPVSGPPWLTDAYGHLPLPISVTHDRKLVWVNPEFERFYSCQLENVKGKEMKDVVVNQRQLDSQIPDIRKLNDALEHHGLGIHHFWNLSHGREVGVLVLAFSIHHRQTELRVGIAIPDDRHNLFSLLVRHLVTPEFDGMSLLGKLTERQIRCLRDLSMPGTMPQRAGGGRAKNGARDIVREIAGQLAKNNWLQPGKSLVLGDLILLALSLGPLLQAPQATAASQPPSPRRRG